MIETVITAAKEKFGEVEEIAKHKNGGYILMIRRSDPANAEYSVHDYSSGHSRRQVDFRWGLYDLTEDRQ